MNHLCIFFWKTEDNIFWYLESFACCFSIQVYAKKLCSCHEINHVVFFQFRTQSYHRTSSCEDTMGTTEKLWWSGPPTTSKRQAAQRGTSNQSSEGPSAFWIRNGTTSKVKKRLSYQYIRICSLLVLYLSLLEYISYLTIEFYNNELDSLSFDRG